MILILLKHDLFILFHADKVDINNTYQLTTSENEEYFFCYSNRKRFRKSNAYQGQEFGNLFTYNELSELTNINDLFNKWFLLYDNLNYPIELIINCLSDISMNGQHKFMNLIYALEYITVKDLDNEFAKVYYASADQKILDEIENIVNGDKSINQNNLLNNLRTRLSKNRRLSDKFGSYLEQLNLPIQELFKEEHQVFVNKIINTRNHFAHVNNKEPRIETEDLYHYNIKIEAILVFVFYLKLDLPFEKIKLKIRMHDRFKRVIK